MRCFFFLDQFWEIFTCCMPREEEENDVSDDMELDEPEQYLDVDLFQLEELVRTLESRMSRILEVKELGSNSVGG